MRIVSTRGGLWHSLFAVVGIVCIALVLFTGVLQVTHFHANGQIDHDCSLCLTAHHAVQVALAATPILSSQPVVHRVVAGFVPLPRQQFVVKLANRPPPAEPAFA